MDWYNNNNILLQNTSNSDQNTKKIELHNLEHLQTKQNTKKSNQNTKNIKQNTQLFFELLNKHLKNAITLETQT